MTHEPPTGPATSPPACPPAGTLGIGEPPDLIAAVPVLLGFRPRDSLVLLALHGAPSGRHRLGLGVRVDLPVPRHAAAVATRAAADLMLDDPAGAVVLVVGEGPDGRRPGRPRARPRGRRRALRGTGPPRRDVAGAAVAALRALGVAAHAVLWVRRCAAGAPWACYDGCCSGALPDPGSTAAAAQAVAQGQVVYGDRSELRALVAPVARPVLRRRERLLARAVPGGPEPVPAALRRLDEAVAAAARGALRLDDDAVVALALALGLPQVRDEAMRRCAGPDAAAAEQLWAALARECPDPEAAAPAALLALSALVRGRGALANVALDRAEQAWPDHHLTGLLRQAVDARIRPEEVRSWLAG